MEYPRKNRVNRPEQSNVHCPHCSKKWFAATKIVDLYFKCSNCHRRYLICLDENGLSIKPIYNTNDDEQD